MLQRRPKVSEPRRGFQSRGENPFHAMFKVITHPVGVGRAVLLHADVMGDGAQGTARPTNGTDLNGPSLTSNSAHRSFPPAPCLRLDRCDERRADRSRVFLRRML